MKICPICHQENRPPAYFCRACGAALNHTNNMPATLSASDDQVAKTQMAHEPPPALLPVASSASTGILLPAVAATGSDSDLEVQTGPLEMDSSLEVQTGPLEMDSSFDSSPDVKAEAEEETPASDSSPALAAPSEDEEKLSQEPAATPASAVQTVEVLSASDHGLAQSGKVPPLPDESVPGTMKLPPLPHESVPVPGTMKRPPLPDEDVAANMPSVPDEVEELLPLAIGSVVDKRFEVMKLLASDESSNLYLVLDLSACAKCGFSGNQPEKRFCAGCGADRKNELVRGHLRETLSASALYWPDQNEQRVFGEEICDNNRFYLFFLAEEESASLTDQAPVEESTSDVAESEEIATASDKEAQSEEAESANKETPAMPVLPAPVMPIIKLPPEEAENANEETAPMPVLPASVTPTIKLPSLRPEPLAPGTLVAQRYKIVELLASEDGINLYEAQDLRACSTCGFEQNLPDDNFCWECGVDRHNAGPVVCELRESGLDEAAKSADLEEGFIYKQSFYLPLIKKVGDAELLPDPTKPTNMTLSVGYASHVGMIRKLNEDSLSVFTLAGVYESKADPTFGLFIVTDGLGGHDGGEVASKFVTELITERLIRRVLLSRFTATQPHHDDAIMPRLKEAILYANEQLYNLAEERGNDMGCTLTMALVIDQQAYIANVGDSRTYIYREQQLQQISKDHSIIASLIAAGIAEPHEVYTHPERNVIYRSMGHAATLEVDLWQEELVIGDQLLLCSDGLWEAIHNEGIVEVLLTNSDPQVACDEMVHRANLAGGEDNITVILVKVG